MTNHELEHGCGCGHEHGRGESTREGSPSTPRSGVPPLERSPGTPRSGVPPFESAVEYERVSFGYPGAEGAARGAEDDAANAGASGLVLQNISLRVKRGERLGI